MTIPERPRSRAFARFTLSLPILFAVGTARADARAVSPAPTSAPTGAPTSAPSVTDPAVPFEKYQLANGLTVILSEDHRLPQVAVDVWYHVGASDESPGKSGFAHLFEHMMFTGSKHIGFPRQVLEAVGSSTDMANGMTADDHTLYFEVVPSSELPTALWLESDRMGFLLDTLDQKRLEVQRDVVVNERRQRIENRPYGTAKLRTCAILYPPPHPYSSCSIGELADVQGAQLEDVRAFFRRFYGPNNASLSIVGNFNSDDAKALVAKYFGSIPRGPEVVRILGGGKASRLYQALVSERGLASVVSAGNRSRELAGDFTLQATVNAGHTPAEIAPDVEFGNGIDDEPLTRGGLSVFVSKMLLEGTTSRSALDLETARERMAVQLSTSPAFEVSAVHLNTPKGKLAEALGLLSDVLTAPAFNPADVERVRAQLLSSAAGKKGDAVALAKDRLAQLMWGEKNARGLPFGGTSDTLKKITQADLRSFYRSVYLPNNAVIAVSGDVTPDECVAALETSLGAWKRGARLPRKGLRFPEAAASSVVLTDLPTASQSQVWTGGRGPGAAAADILPLLAANTILAGNLVTGRLNANLRTQRGISYWVASSVEDYRDVSALIVHAGIVSKSTVVGVAEYRKELARWANDPFTDEEWARAKEAILRALPSELETNDAVAMAMARLPWKGLPLNYYATLPGRVRAMTKADMTAAVRNAKPESWPMVVVGPKSETLEGLKGLGIPGGVREVAP